MKKVKTRTKTLSILCTFIFALLLASNLNINAATDAPRYSYVVDNDTIAPKCSNAKVGFDTYLRTGYNGDSRIQQESSSIYYYTWGAPIPAGYNCEAWVWLNDARFTSIATYEFAYLDRISYNQDTAPGGWSYIRNFKTQGSLASMTLVRNKNYNTNKNTGADAVQFVVR